MKVICLNPLCRVNSSLPQLFGLLYYQLKECLVSNYHGLCSLQKLMQITHNVASERGLYFAFYTGIAITPRYNVMYRVSFILSIMFTMFP